MKMNWSILKRPLTRSEHKLILIFIICLIFYSLYFILTPRIMKLNSLKDRLQAITNERSVYKQLYENPADYEEVLIGYNDIVKKVPKNGDLSEFIIDVEKWAKEKDITIISIYPQNAMTEDVKEAAVNVIPCEITVNGGFDSLLDFIDELENDSRLSRINAIELNASTDVMAKSSLPWKLVVKVSLYYLPA